jgi:hypothetical protein
MREVERDVNDWPEVERDRAEVAARNDLKPFWRTVRDALSANADISGILVVMGLSDSNVGLQRWLEDVGHQSIYTGRTHVVYPSSPLVSGDDIRWPGLFARTVRLHVRNERSRGFVGTPSSRKNRRDRHDFGGIFCKRALTLR